MRKNPFSLYDFLGYVFPGLMAIFTICFFYETKEITGVSSLFYNLLDFVRSLGGENRSWIEDTIILTIASYVTGHFIAYLSSLTVEQFAIWIYDYPSVFLLSDVPPYHFWKRGDGSIRDKCLKIFWRCIIAIFLLPITVCTILIGKFLGVKYFFVKELDNHLITAIESNRELLASYLGVPLTEGSDYHRVVYHYEYEKLDHHAQKMDNYVALYGFLRSITLICNCVCLWVFLKYVLSSLKYIADFTPDWKAIFLTLILTIITYIFFMGFMKFYRRFTLESLMCLIIDISYKNAIPTSIPNVTYSTPITENANSNITENSNSIVT